MYVVDFSWAKYDNMTLVPAILLYYLQCELGLRYDSMELQNYAFIY